MIFDIASLTNKESFWDSVSVWLSGFVALGVALEAITDFDVLARWLRLDTQERFKLRHDIGKAGLLVLIVALAIEVTAGIESHDISQKIIAGLNSELSVTQAREQELVTSTTELKQQLSDADQIIAQLKEFAVENAKLLIDLKENSHAIVASDANIYEEADAYKASVLGTLKRLNISQDKIDEVDQSDSQLVLGFYENAVFRFGSDTLQCSSEQTRAAFGSDYNKLSPERKHSDNPGSLAAPVLMRGHFRPRVSPRRGCSSKAAEPRAARW